MLGEVKRFHAHARRLHRARRRRRRGRRRRPHPGHVPRARRVLPLLRPALHDPGRVLRLVLRHPRLAGVPGALPVPVPRQPRDALGDRLARSGARSPAAPAPTWSGRPRASPASRPAPASGRCTRHADGVELIDDDGQRHAADAVVVATHPDQALRLLADPTDDERAVLGAFSYSRNETLLHTDSRLLPGRPPGPGVLELPDGRLLRRASDDVQVSYWMNRLQDLDEPVDYLVTLNATDRIDPGTVLRRMVYEHPVYTAGLGGRPAAAARPEHRADRLRRRLPRLGLPRGRLRLRRAGRRGVRSRLVTALQTRPVERAAAVPVATPALYDVRIAHTRTRPAAQLLRVRRLPVAGRPRRRRRRTARPGPAAAALARVAGALRRRRPPRRPGRVDQGQRGRARPGARHRRRRTAC